jgi:hypothetical protein
MKQILLSTIALVTILNFDAVAHHSTAAAYQLSRTEAVEGTVVQVAFREPHTYLHVVAIDRDGFTHRWSLQWADQAALAHDGIKTSTLRPGDRVRVTGHPGRNPDAYQLLITTITRASDGWAWERDASD